MISSTDLPDPLPDNIPDLFAVLYDWFARRNYFRKAVNEQWDRREIRYDPRLKEFTDRVAESGWEIPEPILKELSKEYRNSVEPEQLLPLLKQYPEKEMDAYPVSTVVNRPSSDSAELIKPL
jgi:hypothetical protein